MIFDSTKEKIFFYNFPVILFSLIPFFLITGPFLSDLSLSLICLFFLIYCSIKRNFSYFKNKYFFFFLLFWCYLILNTLINNFNFDSLKISFFFFRFGVFVVAIVTLLEFDDKFLRFFFYCILICFAALVLDGFYQYFFDENILGWKKSVRVSSFFGDEFILGSYLSRLWPILFGLSIMIFKQNNKLILLFILSEVLIFLSGDRTAFFYINLSAIFIIFFSKKLFKLRLATLMISLLIIIAVNLFNSDSKERVIDQTMAQMNLSNDNEKKNIFSIQHESLFISSYKIFLDNKIIGVGVKNFRNFCDNEKYYENEFSCSTHPHNTYLQILSETGIIGFLFLITIVIYYCIYVFKHIFFRFKGVNYFTDFEICLLSGIAIYLWPFIPTGSIFNNWMNITMVLNLPLFIWSRKYFKD